jgi:ABC transporter substrate binding protein
LVSLKVDVMLAVATGAALAAKKATSTIPIVFAGVADPLAPGLVTNLARPGGKMLPGRLREGIERLVTSAPASATQTPAETAVATGTATSTSLPAVSPALA